ncbi:MAG: hypothetical protein ACO31I_08540 [Prochlorotrichaceae cyanobacterium]|jgi:hypothetical protein
MDQFQHLSELLAGYRSQLQGMEKALLLSPMEDKTRIQQKIVELRREMQLHEQEYQKLQSVRSMSLTSPSNELNVFGSSQATQVNSSGNTILQVQGNVTINQTVPSPQNDRPPMSTDKSDQVIKVFGSISQHPKDKNITDYFRSFISNVSKIDYSDSSHTDFSQTRLDFIKQKINDSQIILIFVSSHYFTSQSSTNEFQEIAKSNKNLIPINVRLTLGWEEREICGGRRLGDFQPWPIGKPLFNLRRTAERDEAFYELINRLLGS